jgi:guanylate kinase
VVNDELDLAYEQLLSIVTAEKQRTMRFFPTVPEE